METFAFSMLQCHCGYFNSDIVFPGTRQSPRRIVEEYEMEIYLEDGGITYLGNNAIPIHKGMVLFALPNMERYSILPIKNYYLKLPIQKSPMVDLIEAMPQWYYSVFGDMYIGCIHRILSADIKSDNWKKAAELLQLFSHLQEEKRQLETIDTFSLREVQIVNEAILYMKKNLSRKCTLAEIAGSVHLSAFYFHSIFRRVRGETPQSYLTKLRIEKASNLLLASDTDIQAIAEVCGFSSQSYFTEVFRKQTNMTPRAYRLCMMEKR